jgi:uncharacterized damage-inducible protein DinB
MPWAGIGVCGKVAMHLFLLHARSSAYGCPVTVRGGEGDLERRDFVATLTKHRKLLLRTVRGLSEQQVRLRPTASGLCLGGLIKHVTLAERNWSRFITEGAMSGTGPRGPDHHAATFDMTGDDTMAAILERYQETARLTDELIMMMPSLDVAHRLPEAPWYEQGASWSARRVFLHVIAETAQHAGHADIIRETIDGAKTMG